MEKIILAFILAIIPVINFYCKYYFSKKEGVLNLFKQHKITYLFDWLFVPFNFLCAYVLNVSLEVIIFFLIIAVLAFIFLMFIWMNAHKKEHREVYMFDIKSGKIRAGGIVEFFFFVFEAVLILSFIFFSINSFLVYLGMLILLAFLLLALHSSKQIHGKIAWFDLIIVILGAIVLIGKIIVINT